MNMLFAGAAIAASALAFVLWPLFSAAGALPRRRAAAPRESARDDSAVRALREIEFDRATGKLSDTDYAALTSEYTTRALAELRAADVAAETPVAGGDAAEALVRTARASTVTCAHCDAVCPEPDAVYCSACGGYLPGRCAKCGSAVAESAARFCSSCGWALAA